MNIATEIERLKRAKKELFEAIASKGGSVSPDQKLDDYAGAVNSIPSSVEGSGKYRVRFFDYDGTILKTVYTDGGEVTAPSVPDHERLLFQEWNNDFDNVTSDLDVGAIYTTKSGKCEFDYDLNAQTGLNVEITLNVQAAGIVLEWGDGVTETITTTGNATFSHAYESYGEYTLKVSGDWIHGNCKTQYSLVAAHLNNDGALGMFMGSKALRVCTYHAVTDLRNRGGYTFQGVGALSHFNMPRLFAAELINFAGQSGLKSICFAQCVTKMGSNSFASCGAMDDVVLPRSLVTFGCSFPDSQGLRSITIPEKVAAVDSLCFRNQFGLAQVTMRPTTPPTIAADTFPTNGSLKEIIVPAGCGEAYKSATNWSTFADIIKEEEI